MTLNLILLREKVRTHTGEDETDLDDDAVDLLLNQSYWELMDKYKYREKERSAEFTLTDGTRDYTAPSPFEALQNVSVIDTGGKHHYLRRMTPAKYEEERSSGDNESEGLPEYYIRRQNQIRLHPTPDDDYDAVIYYWTTLADLEEGVVDEPEFPQNWHEILMWGAVWRRLYELGDHVRGDRILKLQARQIATTSGIEEKEEEDSRLSGVDIPPELTEI